MGIVYDAMTRAVSAAAGGRPAPRGFTAQVRSFAGRGTAAARERRIMGRFGVSVRTARRWLAGSTPTKANRTQVQQATDAREERRQAERARRAAATGRLRVETRARFGFVAPSGTTDDARMRMVTATMPDDVTDQLMDAYAGGDEDAMRELVAEGIGRDYFRDSGSRASGLNVEFTDIDYLDMEF